MPIAQITTAGDLRSFLAELMVGIRDGSVEPAQAHAISKLAAQINQSLAVEINTALQLERMGKDRPIAGSMLIGRSGDKAPQTALPPSESVGDRSALDEIDHKLRDDLIWCDQCDMRVTPEDAAGCKSRYCKAKG